MARWCGRQFAGHRVHPAPTERDCLMILVDTTVWIDHLRSPEPELQELLNANEVLAHPMVSGELACGNVADRARFLRRMDAMPQAEERTHSEVRDFIESEGLMGRGIGYIDAHLLYSAFRHEVALIWTRDARLNRIAHELSVAYDETP